MLFSGVGIYAPAQHSAEQKCVFTRGISENRRLLQDVLSVKAIPPNLSEQFECVKSAFPPLLNKCVLRFDLFVEVSFCILPYSVVMHISKDVQQ